MKRILAFLALASCAIAGTWMASPGKGSHASGGPTVTFVDVASSAGSSSTDTETITKTLTSGRFIVVGVGWEDIDRTATVSDTLGNVYTPLTRAANGTTIYAQLFYSLITTGGSATITISFGGLNVSYVQAIAWEFTGATTIDGQNSGTGTGSSAVASGSVATTQASEALCAVVKHYDPVTVTPQGSWVEDLEGSGAIEFQHRVVSSTGTYNSAATLSGNGTWVTSFGAFK